MISIVMVYRNRPEQLARTLKSIKADVEIVIMDDMSDTICDLDDRVKYARHSRGGGYNSQSGLLFNQAVKLATNDLLLIQNPETFHVNDVVGILSEKCEEYRCALPTVYMGDETVDRDEFLSEPRQESRAVQGSDIRISSVHAIYRSAKGRLISVCPDAPLAHFHCGMIYRKDWDALGGYSEKIPQDNDLALRLAEYDIKVWFDGEAICVHQAHGRR
jgi:glycosyltransferase involved in cell wall biosynthesis